MKGYQEPAAIRFWRFVQVAKYDGCWLWQGSVDQKTGYGRFAHEGSTKAHRASYRLFVGPIPDGLCILHTCDVRACVNPAHLRPGTHAENVADMIAKGRGRSRGKSK